MKYLGFPATFNFFSNNAVSWIHYLKSVFDSKVIILTKIMNFFRNFLFSEIICFSPTQNFLLQHKPLQDVKSFVRCVHSAGETVFTVLSPPDTGFYKLEIYAARTPAKKEKVLMPIGRCRDGT